jgi:hypothetical protein
VARSATRAENIRKFHASQTPEQRQAQTAAARRALAIAEIRRQVAESRRAQGLPETVTDDRLLAELAADVLGQDKEGAMT